MSTAARRGDLTVVKAVSNQPVFRSAFLMLNLELGSPQDKDGRSCILTNKGGIGHAVYGPYSQLEAGRYAVQFHIELADEERSARDHRYAVLDVTVNAGNRVLERKDIFASQLRGGRTAFTLKFEIDSTSRVEYRVWVSGRAALLIDEHRPVVALPERGTNPQDLLAARAFPEAEGAATPFFQQHVAHLRSLHEAGVGVRIEGDVVVLTVDGVSMYARSLDDLNFVGEVFHERVYDFIVAADVCVIDVGLNIGLSSLMFAKKANVREIHAFEPFRTTFDRARDNIELNPDCATKIAPLPIGLSNRNHDDTIIVEQDHNSGGMSTVGAAVGIPIHVTLRDAGEVLEPIIRAARAKGLKVVAKIDCEGSEYAIFESLTARGLIEQISVFMVEWHAMHDSKSQKDLIAPLEQAGFVVFDRSPPNGNGFFYAVRVAAD